MVKTILVDGAEHLFILERGWGDDGVLINYLSPNPDGIYSNFRSWFSDPAMAQSEFDKIDEPIAREKKRQAVDLDAGKGGAVVGRV